MPADIPSALVRYFAEREDQRAHRVEATLAAMTDRERALVGEAAVMGYVTGVWAGPHRAEIPLDAAIVAEVINACLAKGDLYPTIAGLISARFAEGNTDANAH